MSCTVTMLLSTLLHISQMRRFCSRSSLFSLALRYIEDVGEWFIGDTLLTSFETPKQLDIWMCFFSFKLYFIHKDSSLIFVQYGTQLMVCFTKNCFVYKWVTDLYLKGIHLKKVSKVAIDTINLVRVNISNQDFICVPTKNACIVQFFIALFSAIFWTPLICRLWMYGYILNKSHFCYISRSGNDAAPPMISPLLSLTMNNPSDVLDMPVDPNEPTYCLCHQVSYGEMIGCDNLDVSISFTVLYTCRKIAR